MDAFKRLSSHPSLRKVLTSSKSNASSLSAESTRGSPKKEGFEAEAKDVSDDGTDKIVINPVEDKADKR